MEKIVNTCLWFSQKIHDNEKFGKNLQYFCETSLRFCFVLPGSKFFPGLYDFPDTHVIPMATLPTYAQCVEHVFSLACYPLVNFKNWVFGRPLHSKKCSPYITISKHVTIGLFFFEDDRGNAVSVIKEHYIPVLEQFWGDLEECEGVNGEKSGFTRVVASLHIVKVTSGMGNPFA